MSYTYVALAGCVAQDEEELVLIATLKSGVKGWQLPQTENKPGQHGISSLNPSFNPTHELEGEASGEEDVEEVANVIESVKEAGSRVGASTQRSKW